MSMKEAKYDDFKAILENFESIVIVISDQAWPQ